MSYVDRSFPTAPLLNLLLNYAIIKHHADHVRHAISKRAFFSREMCTCEYKHTGNGFVNNTAHVEAPASGSRIVTLLGVVVRQRQVYYFTIHFLDVNL